MISVMEKIIALVDHLVAAEALLSRGTNMSTESDFLNHSCRESPQPLQAHRCSLRCPSYRNRRAEQKNRLDRSSPSLVRRPVKPLSLLSALWGSPPRNSDAMLVTATGRRSFTGDGKTDGADYAWLQWKAGEHNEIGRLRILALARSPAPVLPASAAASG